MSTTPNFNFDLVESADLSRGLIDWVSKHFGESESSNLMRLDTILADLQANAGLKIVESATEPIDLSVGDEWDKLL